MRATGWLLTIGVAAIRPSHDLEIRCARPSEMTFKASAFAPDRHCMAGARMGFGPTIEHRLGSTLLDMPAVYGAIGRPAPCGSNDQVGVQQPRLVMREDPLRVACETFDLEMRKIRLEPSRECFGLVLTHSRRAERMAADIRPAQVSGSTKTIRPTPARRMRRPLVRLPTAAQNDDSGGKEPFGSGILISAMDPWRIGAGDQATHNRSLPKVAADNQRLRHSARAKPF